MHNTNSECPKPKKTSTLGTDDECVSTTMDAWVDAKPVSEHESITQSPTRGPLLHIRKPKLIRRDLQVGSLYTPFTGRAISGSASTKRARGHVKGKRNQLLAFGTKTRSRSVEGHTEQGSHETELSTTRYHSSTCNALLTESELCDDYSLYTWAESASSSRIEVLPYRPSRGEK